MPELQDWQKHIHKTGGGQVTRYDDIDYTSYVGGEAWCGHRIGMEFVFVGIEHAYFSVKQESLTQPCPDCYAKAVAELAALVDDIVVPDKPGVINQDKADQLVNECNAS